MHCVLLFTIPSALGFPQSTGIVMVTESVNDNYKIYQAQPSNIFPIFGEESNIHRLKTWVSDHGSYTTGYCSDILSTKQIKGKVAKHYDRVRKLPDSGPTQDEHSENHCLDTIKSFQQYTSAENPVSITFLVENRHCSEVQIASLAYQSKIKVVGDYRYFGPQKSSAKYSITADRPLDMKNVLFGASFLLETIDERDVSAIGWFQGFLHVFEKSIDSDMWFLTTKIGNEKDNGYLIVSSLIGNPQFSELKDTWDILPYGVRGKDHTIGSFDKFSYGLKNSLRNFMKIFLDNEVCSLRPAPAVGQIGLSRNYMY